MRNAFPVLEIDLFCACSRAPLRCLTQSADGSAVSSGSTIQRTRCLGHHVSRYSDNFAQSCHTAQSARREYRSSVFVSFRVRVSRRGRRPNGDGKKSPKDYVREARGPGEEGRGRCRTRWEAPRFSPMSSRKDTAPTFARG